MIEITQMDFIEALRDDIELAVYAAWGCCDNPEDMAEFVSKTVLDKMLDNTKENNGF